jgi:hypothetical protein
MARTKNPHEAAIKAWKTRKKNAEAKAAARTATGPSYMRGDWRKRGTGEAPTADYNPTGEFSPEASQRLFQHEHDHRHDRKEQAMIMSPDGTIRFKKDGKRNFVEFTTDDEFAMLEGCVFTHNHPKSTPLSVDDVKMAIQCNMKEIRCMGPNGTLYRLGTTKGWGETMGKKGTKYFWSNLASRLDDLKNDSVTEIRQMIRLGEITVDEANAQIPTQIHEVLTQWADMFKDSGVYYRRLRDGE